MLSASRFSHTPLDFTLQGPHDLVHGGVDPGGARPPVRLTLCVPAAGSVDATLTTVGSARIPDGRTVALHVDRIDVTRSAVAGC